jgi:NAD(P)H-flavin reductase/ferredoxin
VARIHFGGNAYTVHEGSTVLEVLEREGHTVPSSCRSGVCQSCLVRATKGTPPAAAQAGLKDTLIAQGYFLACRAEPGEDLEIISAADSGLGTTATVAGVRPLSARVVEVALRPEPDFAYWPGQFVTLINPEGVARSYSLASVPAHDEHLLLQVAVLPGGVMSGWLTAPETLGTRVQVQGPHGNCFYVPGAPGQPLFLLGTGTGLAPLQAIARDALHQGHTGEIHLFHGALTEEGLYQVDELRAVEAAHGNFHYHPGVLRGPAPAGIHEGKIDEHALATVPSLAGHRVFLCGAPELVRPMQRKAFLAGASMQAIFADPFVPAAAPVTPESCA